MKVIDYTIRDMTRSEGFSEAQSEFATKVDVESIRKEIVALNERVDSMTKKGVEAGE